MKEDIENLIGLWQKRNIKGIFCQNKEQARARIAELIPKGKAVGISGSKTLDQLKAVDSLVASGIKVFDQYRPGISRQESLELRTQGANADCYLTSANAITKKGELIFFSAFSHRIVGISQAKNVIVVTGINKIVDNLNAGFVRVRDYVTPLNCQRLNWNTPCIKDNTCHSDECNFPEYKRMCDQILIIEAEISPGRLTVILVGEELGY